MITLGLLAPVDSGKTTLSEAILYRAGAIRKLGRVDHKTAFLDNNAIEKNRGITVFSKEAYFSFAGKEFMLIDNPGHKDFVAETERAIMVLDYAVLIVSAVELVRSETKLLWELLENYEIPAFIFVNKCDRAELTKDEIAKQIRSELSEGILTLCEESYEDIASLDEGLMDEFLKSGTLSKESLKNAIRARKLTPLAFGSALKLEGIDELLALVSEYVDEAADKAGEFKARVFKITRDERGVKETHVKVLSGAIDVKEGVATGEKVQQIRLYKGQSYEMLKRAEASAVVALTGLENAKIGELITKSSDAPKDAVEPVLKSEKVYSVIFSDGLDAKLGFKKLEKLAEERPDLALSYDELRDEVHISLMGSLEAEVLISIVKERFGLDIDFGKVSEIVFVDEMEEEIEEERNLALEEFHMSGDDEKDLERIFIKTFGRSKRDEQLLKANHASLTRKSNYPNPNPKEGRGTLETHLIIDGYNVLYAWEELKEIAKFNQDAARDALIEALQNYQGFKRIGITLVFDGYKVKGGLGSEQHFGDIKVVYTKEAETADKYIEHLIYEGGKKYDYTVVTSDLAVQMAAFGDGARRISSREFYLEVMNTSQEIRNRLKLQTRAANRPFEEVFSEK